MKRVINYRRLEEEMNYAVHPMRITCRKLTVLPTLAKVKMLHPEAPWPRVTF